MLADVTDTVISGPFALAGLLALAAGLVSFASPCVVPLVPGYLSYLVGLVGSRESSLRAVGAAALFVAGFSVVFIAESALVLGVYTSLIANQETLTRVAGVVSIVMAVVLALPALQREWRPGMTAGWWRRAGRAERAAAADGDTAVMDAGDASNGRGVSVAVVRRSRLWGAPLLGAAFGTGWLACTSPTLAGILALSTATEWNGSAARGLLLVVLYCVGLGIPFLLLAFGFGWAGRALGVLRRHARGIQLAGAIALAVIGVAMVTGWWADLLSPLRGSVLLL